MSKKKEVAWDDLPWVVAANHRIKSRIRETYNTDADLDQWLTDARKTDKLKMAVRWELFLKQFCIHQFGDPSATGEPIPCNGVQGFANHCNVFGLDGTDFGRVEIQGQPLATIPPGVKNAVMADTDHVLVRNAGGQLILLGYPSR